MAELVEILSMFRHADGGMTEADKIVADGMTPDLHPAQIEAYRRMTPQDKFRAMGRIYRQAWRLKMAWLRNQNPQWSEEEILNETRRIFLHASTG
jgi:hypothetical protein